jgi:hypothetical protein
VTGDAAAGEKAWKMLESIPGDREKAADLGAKEPVKEPVKEPSARRGS